MNRLAIISTHPIQYNVPFFRKLAELSTIEVKVFYTYSQSEQGFTDPGFGKVLDWNIPLLDGYQFEFVENKASKPSNRSFFGINCPELIEKINTFNPNAILIYGWNFKAHFEAMRYFKNKVPVWFRGDSHLLDEKPGLKTLLRRILLRFVYKHIDLAFFVGSSNYDYYLAHGLKPNQLAFAPHAIDNEYFTSKLNPQASIKLRTDLKIAPIDFVVLFAGKFEPKKNPNLILDAAAKMPYIKFILAGSGILENELKNNAVGLTNISFLPFQSQPEMPILYGSADVFVYPSVGPGETWGLAVNEALACKLPVIISNRVGCAANFGLSEVVKVFDSEKKVDFFDAIRFFYNNRIDKVKIGEEAQNLVSNYKIDNFVLAVETAFKNTKKL
ncbi:MAG TPA: glycosyl transferase family 1 [Bacteroidales bacterium]|nr:glycosyl transferase family 1 [Bacteroidales bacterium]